MFQTYRILRALSNILQDLYIEQFDENTFCLYTLLFVGPDPLILVEAPVIKEKFPSKLLKPSFLPCVSIALLITSL